jgi:lysophospholipase L1-like esterase
MNKLPNAPVVKVTSAFLSVLLLLSTITEAQTPHWSAVPEHVSQNKEVFQQLFQDAATDGLGITVLGDSQETTFGGAGRDYISALNEQFFQQYGNTPKTAYVPPSNFVHGWHLSSSDQGSISTTNSTLLPGVRVAEFSNSSETQHGFLSHFSQFGGLLASQPEMPTQLFSGDQIKVELLAATKPGSSEIDWRVNANNDLGRRFFGGTDVGVGTTNLGLDQSALAYVNADLGTYDLGDFAHVQVIAQGDDAASSVDLLGARFVNASDSSGVSVQSFSRGGLRVMDFLSDFGDGADLFNAVAGDDIVALSYGANDGRSRTADQFKSDLATLIDRLRLWTDNPDLAVVLMGDPDNGLFTESARENFDLFPGVAAEIATEFDNVLALNTRLLSSRIGWDIEDPNFDLFVTDDQIHYTPAGATALAQLQVESLVNISAVPEPSALVFSSSIICCLLARRRRVQRIF